jgi:hypothetical protein
MTPAQVANADQFERSTPALAGLAAMLLIRAAEAGAA